MNVWLERAKAKQEIEEINKKIRDKFSSKYPDDRETLAAVIKWIKENYGDSLLSKVRFYHQKWTLWDIRKNYWQVTLLK